MFVQIMDFRTTRREEMAQLEEEWRAATDGARAVRRVVIGQDRKDPNRYLLMAFYDDYESAKADHSLPETINTADRQAQFFAGLPSFMDLDVVKDVEY